jgi:hypothetical protein
MAWKSGTAWILIFLSGQSILFLPFGIAGRFVLSRPSRPQAGWAVALLVFCFAANLHDFVLLLLLRIPCEAFAAIYLLLIAAIPPGGSA